MRLLAKKLAAERGGRRLFDNLSFTLEPGTLTTLTGPNGSGKTSLLRLIAGLGDKLSGTLTLQGGDPELPIGAQAHYVAHQEALKLALTARENLEFWATFFGAGNVAEALNCFALQPLADHPAAWCSEGQRRRLALARLALCHRPIWLLDEPTVGLDTASQTRLSGLMSRFLAQGGIVLAATHVPLKPKPDQEIRLGNNP
jgi:heme exporter protein A